MTKMENLLMQKKLYHTETFKTQPIYKTKKTAKDHQSGAHVSDLL